MSIKRLALFVGSAVVTGIVVGIGGLTAFNFYTHNNISYETEHIKVRQKADGIMGFTQLEIDKKTGAVDIIKSPPYRAFTDKDGDGIVDRVFRIVPNELSRGSHSRGFDRANDLEKYSAVFQDADREFSQEIERFQPLL